MLGRYSCPVLVWGPTASHSTVETSNINRKRYYEGLVRMTSRVTLEMSLETCRL